MLTLAGQNAWGELILSIPNLVVRKLYVERLQERLLPDYTDHYSRMIDVGYALRTFGQV